MKSPRQRRAACAVLITLALVLLVTALPSFAAVTASQREVLHARYDRINKMLRDGRLDEAMKQARKALDMARSMYGNDAANTAPAIDRIAAVYRAMGRFAEAEAHFRQALDLVTRDVGESHYYAVSAMNNLAGLYQAMGRYVDAEQLYQRALAIQRALPEKSLEEELGLLDNLAVLYMKTARYSEAEPILVRAVALAEKSTVPDKMDIRMNISKDEHHLEWARRLLNLAALYFKLKRYQECESLSLQGLGIFRRILGEGHPETARVKNELGVLNSVIGRNDLAERLLTDAINSALTTYGDKPQPVVAEYYVNLAQHYQGLGMNTEALRFADHARDILIKTLGATNPKTLQCLNNIAVIHMNLGNMKQAEVILRGVLETAMATFGENHESLATNMANLGSVLAAQGRHNEANLMFSAAIAINERTRDDAFLLLSEQQKLEYVATMLYQVQFYLAHVLRHGATDKAAVAKAMDTWLRWKGAVMEAQGRFVDALYRSDNPQLQQRFDELVRVKRELARAQLNSDDDKRPHLSADARHDLEKRKDKLEAELSRLSKEFAFNRMIDGIRVDKLAAVVPPDGVYVDFAEVAAADFSPQDANKPRYAAFVLTPGPDGALAMVDIADKETLDGLVRGYLQEMKKKAEGQRAHDARQLDRLAADLYAMVVKPLEPFFKGRKHLFVSPDGALHLLPFEVLRTQQGSYLLESYRVSYVASGRDLLRQSTPDGTTASGPALVIADPDFDLGQLHQEGGRTGAGTPQTQTVRGSLTKDFAGIRFDRLPDTKQEADAITRILATSGTRVTTYQGKQALEEALFATRNPKILHLATHGYFLTSEASAGAGTRGLMRQQKGADRQASPSQLDNPMLRSGIVLAGANTSLKSGSDEGLVSAEKILGLRLRGTDLVTLSACETAVGDVQTGEGVFGLKRAFLLSGAKTLVMSLWSVPSVETTELMTDFYGLMAAGSAKGQALRQAKLNMMKRKPHPFYWGAFIMIGRPD